MSDWETVAAPSTPPKDAGDWETVRAPAALPPSTMPRSGRIGDPTSVRPNATAVTGALSLLNRPNEAVLAKHAGRGFWHTLAHGEPPEQYDADAERATREMMGASPQEFAQMPAVRRAANTFATEMVTDPLTYLGGTGIMRKVFEEGGLHVLPATIRAGAKLGQKTAGTSLSDAFKLTSEAAGWLHDQITPGGKPVAHAIRELALKHGAEGMRQAERMTSAASGSRSVAAHVAAVGKQLLDGTLKNVPADAQSAIFKAIHDGAIEKLPEPLRPVADRLVEIDRSIPWLLGTKSMRAQLTKRGFVLPQEFRVFDQGPRAIVKVSGFREHHVPLPHELDDQERAAAFENLKRRGGSRALTDTRSPFFQRRATEPPSNAFNDPEMIRETWERSFAAAGRAMGGADMRSNLVRIFAQTPTQRTEQLEELGTRMRSGDLSKTPVTLKDVMAMVGRPDEPVPEYKFGEITKRIKPEGDAERAALGLKRPPATNARRALVRSVPKYVRDAYAEQPGTEPGPVQSVIRELEKLGNLGKSTLFTTPFPHQRNIATLLALANPSTFPAAIANYARMRGGLKILGASPSRTSQVLGEAMRAGATGLPNIEQSGLTDLLRKFGPLGKAASTWYGGVGKMLWGWDDAVKKALYDRELKHFGGDAGRAAASVRRKLVDYSQASPFQQAVRLIAPFATWRTAMPSAVIRSIAEHPEYAVGLMRATHGTIAGEPFDVDGKSYKVSGPIADVNELLGPDYGKYVRSSTSLTSKVLADLAAAALRQKERPFSAKEIESNVPFWSLLGNPYGDTLEERALYNATGIHRYTETSKRRRRHRPRFTE